MAIKFSKKAKAFLFSLDRDKREAIRHHLLELHQSLEESHLIPYRELHIKKLKGEWKGFYRMRVGKIRVIFRIAEGKEVYIYDIQFRGKAYKP